MPTTHPKRSRPRKPVRRFPPPAPIPIVIGGVLIGSLRTRGCGPLYDARTINNGGLGAFASRETAIAALEAYARKQKRRKDMPPERLRYLAGAVHSLGPRPLFELFRELVAGRDLMQRLERYAQLDADFIRALGGDQLPSRARLVGSS
jgi:hypothetical protein